MSEFAAIPTLYNGIRFRSRLEAKWACVFDLLGWSWEYEPVDLNGWIPDFVITSAANLLYVEVKPITRYEDFPIEITEKIKRIVPDDEVLLAAAAILKPEFDDYCFGWLSDDLFGTGWMPAVLNYPRGNTKRYGLTCGMAGGYAERISGDWDGDRGWSPTDVADFQRIWLEAANRVQWRAPK